MPTAPTPPPTCARCGHPESVIEYASVVNDVVYPTRFAIDTHVIGCIFKGCFCPAFVPKEEGT